MINCYHAYNSNRFSTYSAAQMLTAYFLTYYNYLVTTFQTDHSHNRGTGIILQLLAIAAYLLGPNFRPSN